jgi:hypothetical protein
LFTKGTQSIWVECVDGQALVIAGPGTERKAVDYRSEAELQTGQIALAETLSSGGALALGEGPPIRPGAARRQPWRFRPAPGTRPSRPAVSPVTSPDNAKASVTCG